MVREGEGAVCYCWSAIENTWNKVGEVLSGSGGTQQSSGKVLYRGKVSKLVFFKNNKKKILSFIFKIFFTCLCFLRLGIRFRI